MKEMICIVCPRGCRLTYDGNEVKGNFCKRGEVYAKQEAVQPLRMVTSTVSIKSKEISRLPVITSGEIPKDKIFDIMKELYNIEVVAPIKVGEIIVENILNLGVNIISTREVLK